MSNMIISACFWVLPLKNYDTKIQSKHVEFQSVLQLRPQVKTEATRPQVQLFIYAVKSSTQLWITENFPQHHVKKEDAAIS